MLSQGLTAENDDGGNTGIFSNAGGELEKVVFEGDAIEVADGDFRTVDSNNGLRFWRTSYTNQTHNSNKMFNDDGDVAFIATFSDGSSGIFVAELIPEPSTCVLAILLTIASTGIQRCRI